MSSCQHIHFPTAAGEAGAYLSRPRAGRPGVVVIQEWFGLVPHVKDIADRFAAQGYVAMAPDLYHGKSTVEAEEARHLMQGLDWGRAAAELAGAVRHLREVEGCTHVGVVGYCMGGALAVITAAQGHIDAYAAFYGFPPKGAVDLSRVSAKGLIFFGEHEGFFSVPDAQAFAAAQRARDVSTEVIVYPGAGHAFFRDTDPATYKAEAANDAWRRTLDLFGRTLRG